MDDEQMQQVFENLANTLSPVDHVRRTAEANLYEFSQHTGFLLGLFRVLNSEDVAFDVRHSGVTYFKNNLQHRWEGSRKPEIAAEEKQAIRDNIIEAIIRSPRLIRNMLELVLSEIIQADYHEGRFPQFDEKVLGYLNSEDVACITGATLSLFLFSKYYEMKPAEKREPFNRMIAATFPRLRELLVNLVGVVSQESADVQRWILKTYWASFQMTNPGFLQNPTVVGEWMSVFDTILSTPVPAEIVPESPQEREVFIYFKIKKEVMEILNRYFSRFGQPKLVSDAMRPFATYFNDTYSVPILEKYMGMLDEWRNGAYLSKRQLQLAMCYLEVAFRQAMTWRVVYPNLEVLYEQVMFRILLISEEDLQMWTTDPQEYIRKVNNIFEDFVDPVTACINSLSELVKIRAKHALPMITMHAYKCLTTYAEAQNPQNDLELCRIKDAALVSLGAIAKKLILSNAYKDMLEGLLLTHVVPEFQNPHGFMRARACWVCQQFVTVKFTTLEIYGNIINSVRACMRDPDLPVRVFATQAMQSLVVPEIARDILLPHLGEIFQDFFTMFGEVEHGSVVSALDTLVVRYDEAVAPLAMQLTQGLADTFLRILKDEQDETEDQPDAGLAAVSCLHTISNLVHVLRKQPAYYPQMEQILQRVLERLMLDDMGDFYEDALEIIVKFTYFGKHISDTMWALFPQIHKSVVEYNIDYIENVVPVYDNYISLGQDVLFGYDDGKYAGMIVDLIVRTLTDVEYRERYATEGCKLAEIMLHWCHGRIDNLIGQFITMAAQRMRTARSWALRVSLLELVMNCLIYNPGIAMQELQNQELVRAFFDAIPNLGDHFKRMHDKKLVMMGVISLFKLPIAELSPDTHQQLGALFNNLLLVTRAQIEAVTEYERLLGEESSSSTASEDWGNDEGVPDDQDDVTDADMAYLAHLEEKAQTFHRYINTGLDEIEDGEELEDDNEYETPLDDINEFIFFVDTMQELAQNQPEVYQTLMDAVDPSVAEVLPALQARAEHEREEAAKEAAEEEEQ